MGLYLLDYGAGNVQSLANSLSSLGHTFKWISHIDDFAKATVSHYLFYYCYCYFEDGHNRPWYSLELVLLMLLLHTSSLVVFLNHFETTFYLENPTSVFA